MNAEGNAATTSQGASAGITMGNLLADTRVSVPSTMVSGIGSQGFMYMDPGTGSYIPGLKAASAEREEYLNELQAIYAVRDADYQAKLALQKSAEQTGQIRARVGRSGVVSSGSAEDVQNASAIQGEQDAIMERHKGRLARDVFLGRAQLAEYDKLLAEASYVAPKDMYQQGQWYSGHYWQGQSGGHKPDYVGAALVGMSYGSQMYSNSQNPSFQE